MAKSKYLQVEDKKRLPTLLEALVPIFAMIIILSVGRGMMELPMEPLLIMVAAVAGAIAFRVGVTWEEMLSEISVKVSTAMPSILILICVGALVGTWMAAGTVPMLIYYGVQIVNPDWMLVTSFLITAVISVVTGTSWGSVATMGVVMMSISATLDISLPATAGACIAGSYFGDKISPFSDTTNLAPVAAGSELYEHIQHMFYTTIPASLVALAVYAFAGMNGHVTANVSSDTVNTLLAQFDMMFRWSPWLLLPMAMVLAGSIMKLPSLPIMLLSTVVAGVEASIFQGINVNNIFDAVVNGFKVEMITHDSFDASICSAEVLKLLNRGGMLDMMGTILFIICAFCFAGIMSKASCLDVILREILALTKSTGDLITATIAAGMGLDFIVGDAYLSIIVAGEMFRDAYKKRNLAAKNLSRTLEDSATMIIPLVPWSSDGVFMAATLGVATWDYLPWAVLCYSSFIFAILWGYLDIGIAKLEKK